MSLGVISVWLLLLPPSPVQNASRAQDASKVPKGARARGGIILNGRRGNKKSQTEITPNQATEGDSRITTLE